MAGRLPPSRVSRGKLLAQLRLAARKGDRTALTLALDQMRTLAYAPRHWEKYLLLLADPLARLVDLLVIKQGDAIARQKGWVRPKRQAASERRPKSGRRGTKKRSERQRQSAAAIQPSLFPELG